MCHQSSRPTCWIRQGHRGNPESCSFHWFLLRFARTRANEFLHYREERIRAIAFVQECIGKPLQGLRYLVGTTAPDHNRNGGLLFHKHLRDLITVPARHLEIENYRVNRLLASKYNSGRSGGSDQNLEAFTFKKGF